MSAADGPPKREASFARRTLSAAHPAAPRSAPIPSPTPNPAPAPPPAPVAEPPAGDTSFEGATRRVAFNSLIQGAGKLFGYGSAILVLALTARLLSKSAYGDYTIAFVYVSFVYAFADAGISLIGVREASKEPERLQEVLSAILSLKLLFAMVMYALALVIAFFLPYPLEVKLAILLFALTMFFVSLASSFDVAFQSRLQMQFPTVAEVGLRLVMLGGTVGVFLFNHARPLGDAPLFYLVVVIAAAGNLTTFAIRWLGARRLVTLKLGIDRRYARYLLALAAPMAIVAVLSQVHYKADTIILSLLKPDTDVAIYGVAYKIIDFLLVFSGVFAGLVFPVLSRYSNTPDMRFRQARRRALNMSLSLALPATVGTILLAPGIVLLIGGGRYPQSVLTLQILAVSAIFSFVNTIYSYLIIIQNRQRSLIWVSCVNIAANVALNLLVIPRYSYLGSAVATVITECLGMSLSIYVATRGDRISPAPRIVLRVLLACAAMGTAVVGAQVLLFSMVTIPSTIALAGLGAAVYGATLYLIGGVDPALAAIIRQRLSFRGGSPPSAAP